MRPQPTPSEEVTFVGSGGSMDPTPQERRRPPPWWWWCRIVWLVVDSTFCTIPIIGGVIMMQWSRLPPHLDTSPASTTITVSIIAAAADSKVTTHFPLSWKWACGGGDINGHHGWFLWCFAPENFSGRTQSQSIFIFINLSTYHQISMPVWLSGRAFYS